MAILISMPMFIERPIISLEILEKYVVSNWSDIAKFEDKEESDSSFSFNIGNAFIAVGVMAAPIPWGDLEGPCATSILWPDSKNELQQHQFHSIVTVSSEELTAIELSVLLTQITAALVAVTNGAIGVFWSNAAMVIPRKIFIEFASEILPQGPPVHIWVDFRVGTNEAGHSSGFTSGLARLGLMEIESTHSPESVAELRDRLTGLAEYLLINGLVINDGDTIGEDENAMIRVLYEKSSFGHEDNILGLHYLQAKPKKSRFKFW